MKLYILCTHIIIFFHTVRVLFIYLIVFDHVAQNVYSAIFVLIFLQKQKCGSDVIIPLDAW